MNQLWKWNEQNSQNECMWVCVCVCSLVMLCLIASTWIIGMELSRRQCRRSLHLNRILVRDHFSFGFDICGVKSFFFCLDHHSCPLFSTLLLVVIVNLCQIMFGPFLRVAAWWETIVIHSDFSASHRPTCYGNCQFSIEMAFICFPI